MNWIKTIFFSLVIYSSALGLTIDENLYNELNVPTLDKEAFQRALNGLSEIQIDKKNIITIIDYTKSANDKRLFVIDLQGKKVLFDTYVAHGKNSGDEFAKYFSNNLNSKQSSVGFFKTSNTYFGNNGYSVRLDGLEEGINHRARERNIVIHGADYATESFILKYGRLGRSWGCPAVPKGISKEIIDVIKDGSLVYINGDLDNYNKKTQF